MNKNFTVRHRQQYALSYDVRFEQEWIISFVRTAREMGLVTQVEPKLNRLLIFLSEKAMELCTIRCHYVMFLPSTKTTAQFSSMCYEGGPDLAQSVGLVVQALEMAIDLEREIIRYKNEFFERFGTNIGPDTPPDKTIVVTQYDTQRRSFERVKIRQYQKELREAKKILSDLDSYQVQERTTENSLTTGQRFVVYGVGANPDKMHSSSYQDIFGAEGYWQPQRMPGIHEVGDLSTAQTYDSVAQAQKAMKKDVTKGQNVEILEVQMTIVRRMDVNPEYTSDKLQEILVQAEQKVLKKNLNKI